IDRFRSSAPLEQRLPCREIAGLSTGQQPVDIRFVEPPQKRIQFSVHTCLSLVRTLKDEIPATVR
ncbi:MAG: hypothetical protein ACK56I_21790, partial [bacterium]